MATTTRVIINKTSGSVGIFTTGSTFPLQVAGNIGPNLNAIYDLGSSASAWKNIYGTASVAISASWAPTGGGVVSGGSYNISASWASASISASYAPGSPSISASYAGTASYLLNTTDGIEFTASGSINNQSNNIVVIQHITGSYGSAVFDYVAVSGSNQRAGMMIGTWNGSNVSYTEMRTTDIGNTSDLTLAIQLSGNSIQLVSNANSYKWFVEAVSRYVSSVGLVSSNYIGTFQGLGGSSVSASYALTASYAINGGGGVSNITNPTYMMMVTASQNVSSSSPISRMINSVYVSSSYVNPDGSDIRVQKVVSGSISGSYLPIAIQTLSLPNNMQYNVFWKDTFISNSNNYYAITYGDSNATPMYISSQQASDLRSFGSTIFSNTNSIVYIDNTKADRYNNSDWGTIGIRLNTLTNGDDTSQLWTLSSSYWWNNGYYPNVMIGSNCAFGLASNTASNSSQYVAYTPDSLSIIGTDGRCIFCDYVLNADGFSFQFSYQASYSNTGAIAKIVYRYYNSGRWVISCFDTNPLLQTAIVNSVRMAGYTGGTLFTTNLYAPTGSISYASPIAIVIEPVVSTITGSEKIYTP